MQSLSDVAADQVRQHRERRGISRDELAKRCADLGAPQLTYSALVNIETGRKGEGRKRRRDVTVDELAVLAKALGVPPLALLFPVGGVEEVQVLPDRSAPTWDGLRWFTGEAALPTRSGDQWGVSPSDFADWEADRAGLTSYRWHETYLKRWHEDRREAEEAPKAETREAAQRRMEAVEPALWQERARIRGLGLRLPDLPAELRHIDADGYQPDWGRVFK
ncbi:helix-turn-helix domain-containing protein [Streptomyces sp. enrichment culture]|uniref:helix-turn-helix domain-containing protein n=1 Tax=Streptomyces sp. enrichment culture TaxID=1795815 RepID=UPI003F54643E